MHFITPRFHYLTTSADGFEITNKQTFYQNPIFKETQTTRSTENNKTGLIVKECEESIQH